MYGCDGCWSSSSSSLSLIDSRAPEPPYRSIQKVPILSPPRLWTILLAPAVGLPKVVALLLVSSCSSWSCWHYHVTREEPPPPPPPPPPINPTNKEAEEETKENEMGPPQPSSSSHTHICTPTCLLAGTPHHASICICIYRCVCVYVCACHAVCTATSSRECLWYNECRSDDIRHPHFLLDPLLNW